MSKSIRIAIALVALISHPAYAHGPDGEFLIAAMDYLYTPCQTYRPDSKERWLSAWTQWEALHKNTLARVRLLPTYQQMLQEFKEHPNKYHSALLELCNDVMSMLNDSAQRDSTIKELEDRLPKVPDSTPNIQPNNSLERDARKNGARPSP